MRTRAIGQLYPGVVECSNHLGRTNLTNISNVEVNVIYL
ncbi:uncharacterized protein METZ01_LOCUS213079 [marine metagenome]|uniref:Uncharacterized protein n=1 Tax=marine metagenome TaxID=408172 RepID=A0A382FC14_9ZZZZ